MSFALFYAISLRCRANIVQMELTRLSNVLIINMLNKTSVPPSRIELESAL